LKGLGGLDVWALFLGIITVWLVAVVISAAWDQGAVAWLSAAFGIFVAFLGLQGLAVLWGVRRNGRMTFRRVTLWLLGICLIFAIAVIPTAYLGDSELVVEGVALFTPVGVASAVLIVWTVFLVLAVLMLAAACGAIWILEKILMATVPRFLMDIKELSFTRRDGLLDRAEAWAVAFPRVLLPSTLRLDPEPVDAGAVRGRFKRALIWQLALGMLLAVYISLNPVLLESMSFSQTFGLVSITSILVPMLVLPWSTLEALGARVDGVREDFYLHKGARTRMIQTMVAFGTLFLIVRLGVEEIGADVIVWQLAGYSLTLFIISGLVSFAYFNYFEQGLIDGLKGRLKEKGL